ncbi:class I SAM-dependent methyltransferase [Streptomyces sp. NPDC048680]|uniref:class I SAM-dependent methyltransferase n=1 Tax=Streptomyces sp. NPDC048680 TaxID=3155492 RepID=UPI0034479D83
MRLRSTRNPEDAVHHPVFARYYARMSVAAETTAGLARIRTELLSGLTGRVIEIGAGNGLNFTHYPPTVSEVVAIEPERTLRQLAVRSALGAGIPVDVIPGTAETLPVGDETFDAAVLSLVLCTVRDVRRSLAEAQRVLRPGGELRFFEHVRADDRAMATTQRVLDATLWPLLTGGCHTSRDALAAIEAAGFVVETHRVVRVPESGVRLPTSACVLGVARRPGARLEGAEGAEGPAAAR